MHNFLKHSLSKFSGNFSVLFEYFALVSYLCKTLEILSESKFLTFSQPILCIAPGWLRAHFQPLMLSALADMLKSIWKTTVIKEELLL